MSEYQSASLRAIPFDAISQLLRDAMQQACDNGANSISMPDEYVAIAHFVAYPQDYAAAPAAPVAAPAPSEWISVADRLPEVGQRVMVFTPIARFGESMFFDTWDEQHECPVSFSSISVPIGDGWNEHDFEEITHWMPLPAHPVADPYAGIASDFAAENMLTTQESPCANT